MLSRKHGHQNLVILNFFNGENKMSKFKEYLEALKDPERKIQENKAKKEKEIKDDEKDSDDDNDVSRKVYEDLEKGLKSDIAAIIKKSKLVFNQSKVKHGYKGSIDDLLDDIFQISAEVEEEDISILVAVLMERK